MVTSDRPTSLPRAMSVAEVEHNATLPTIPPELPAAPVHSGNRYVKGPPPLTPEAGFQAVSEMMRGKDTCGACNRFMDVCTRTVGHDGDHHSDYCHWPQAPDAAAPAGLLGVNFVHTVPNSFRPNTILDRSNTPADDVLPNDAKARKAVPAGAVLDYFDSAWVEIAKALQDGNDQHNPGEELHWSRGKSSDHEHCIIRHYLQRGKLAVSPTGAVIRHSTCMAIRALMFLQEELEANGAPLSRGSKLPGEKA